MQNYAYKELADGKMQKASVRLQRVATHLISLGEHDLAGRIIEESEKIKHTQGFSAEGKKQIKYVQCRPYNT